MDSGSGPRFDDEPPPEPRDGWLLVRVHVPELNVFKCLQFPSDRLVWDVKQQVFSSLPKVAFWFKELKESFNYGLFSPPSNGKAGKFLDEERRLGDYPFNGPVGYLELKYKRRVYKMLNLDERQLKALHTRANLRRFLECIHAGHVEKIAKMCSKGLDPNFHCPETGETPLTVATGAKKPNKLLIALVNGGALLDYRTKDGTTALHKAVEKDSLEAVTTLLELGASPNYKDGRGITPLYLSIARKCDPKVTESLLHDHASLGIQDTQGWNEVHQVAVIAGNMDLAEIIQNFKPDDVVPFRGQPRYNPKRRSAVGWPGGSCTSSCAGSLMGTLPRKSSCCHNGPPSPCPSEHIPYSSASSSLSEGSSGHRSHEDDISIVTDKSLGDTSDLISDSSGVGTNSDSAACSIGHPSTTVVCMEPYSGNAPGHISLQAGDVIEVVGSTDCGLLEGYIRGSNQSGFFPVDCVQEVSLRQKNTAAIHLTSSKTNNTNCQSPYQSQHTSTGDSTKSTVNPQRSPQLSISGNTTTNAANTSVDTLSLIAPNHTQPSPSMSLNSNGSDSAMNVRYHNTLHSVSQFSSATAPRLKKTGFNEPRTIILHRAKRGFGFILRGAKASSPLMQLKPTERFPALQYLDDVDPGGVADMAGLRPGDFLLAIGNEDVRAASHEKVVEMIRSAGALVSMTVISPQFPHQMQAAAQFLPNIYQLSSGPSTPQPSHRQCATLPRKMSLGPGATTGNVSGGSGGVSRMPAPIPPRRDPKTTLSVGRARAKSMVAGLENGGEKDDGEVPHTKSSSVESIITPTPTHPGTPVQLRTASIKARPTSSRITAAELEELFQRQQGESMDNSNSYSTMMTTSRFQSGTDSGAATPPANTNSPMKAPLVYGSVAEMKRKAKIKNGTMRGKPCSIPSVGGSIGHDLKRFHSTPDLNTHLNGSVSSIWAPANKGHHSQDDVATLHASLQRLNVLPPPTHPPPPPPIGQVIKVETRSTSEYESTLSLQQKLKKRAESDAVTSAAIDGIQSSFNPSTNAKIYASPQELRNVMAWKLRQSQENRQTQNDQTQQQQQQSLSSNTQVTALQQPESNPSTQTQQSSSQYAQPTTSQVMLQQSQQLKKTHYDVGQQNGNSEGHTTSNNSNIGTGPAPPIPEPDYSFSESDDEDENSILVARNTKLNEKITLVEIADTCGNSQASGSSTGSTSISHSLSVGEIQRVRSNLKQSKSSPNGFLKSENLQRSVAVTEAGPMGQNKADGILAEDQKNNNKNNDHQINEANGEEGDNSSSGVSSDQEVAGATMKGNITRATDTIKKKPNVTIVEDTKANKHEETLGLKLGKVTTIISNLIEEDIVINSPSSISTICKTMGTLTLPSSNAIEVEAISTSATTTLKEKNEDAPTAEIPPTSKIPIFNVASSAAAFEAKATSTTVTVRQMVQQQHAPAIQQQQQHISATKIKSLTIQGQQMSATKSHQSVSGRLGHVQPQLNSNQPSQQQTTSILPINIPQQHLHPNQKLVATQQHIFLQQQQQQQHQHHHQQQLHQQHLQQILKAKTAAAGVTGTNTAAIVTKQQQQLHKKSQHEGKDAIYESEHEQRSEDEGDLSPSPPAKGFQRHNSLTRKQAAAIAMQRASRSAAVSLMQLPPPIESDGDHYELNSAGDNSNINNPILNTTVPSSGRTIVSVPISAENIVLAPPPQFCDCNDIKHLPQQQLNHIQSTQQQQQQLHFPHQQYQLQMRTHMPVQGGGSGTCESGNVGTMGRMRNLGTTPKTPHHRLH
ncbi:SH3 and multiple ankyrin repeat domains protein 1 isoform X3 [Zeugodacus cucurbitae]|uniref:SH3 and multiple ankyrin repeat domains protein 1 isoform X3 n=1 Tax=Zeugodacus cucurbitae TaxID=28588 RepID=UPI0023D95C28|nr:SH3 and multiple ankyrin repeat domains protein 1 isoform X3 [Zeugodacus cucurbitae]